MVICAIFNFHSSDKNIEGELINIWLHLRTFLSVTVGRGSQSFRIVPMLSVQNQQAVKSGLFDSRIKILFLKSSV